MLRISILLFFVLIMAGHSTAQSNSLEARAAYLLAEENYGKGDMHSALQYLDEASSKLGAANAKILYLKIMVLKEISVKDTSFGSKLDAAITDFGKAPDAADFNEEKTMEVIKIKLERKQFKNTEANVGRALEEYMKKTGWIIGMHVDSLEKQRKDLFVTQPNKYYLDRSKVGENEIISYYGDAKKTKLIDVVIVNKGISISYAHFYFSNKTDNAGFDETKQALIPILEELKNTFGYLPEPVITKGAYDKPLGGEFAMHNYKWESKDLRADLTINYYSPSSGNSAMCALSLSKSHL